MKYIVASILAGSTAVESLTLSSGATNWCLSALPQSTPTSATQVFKSDGTTCASEDAKVNLFPHTANKSYFPKCNATHVTETSFVATGCTGTAAPDAVYEMGKCYKGTTGNYFMYSDNDGGCKGQPAAIFTFKGKGCTGEAVPGEGLSQPFSSGQCLAYPPVAPSSFRPTCNDNGDTITEVTYEGAGCTGTASTLTFKEGVCDVFSAPGQPDMYFAYTCGSKDTIDYVVKHNNDEVKKKKGASLITFDGPGCHGKIQKGPGLTEAFNSGSCLNYSPLPPQTFRPTCNGTHVVEITYEGKDCTGPASTLYFLPGTCDVYSAPGQPDAYFTYSCTEQDTLEFVARENNREEASIVTYKGSGCTGEAMPGRGLTEAFRSGDCLAYPPVPPTSFTATCSADRKKITEVTYEQKSCTGTPSTLTFDVGSCNAFESPGQPTVYFTYACGHETLYSALVANLNKAIAVFTDGCNQANIGSVNSMLIGSVVAVAFVVYKLV